MPVLLGSKGQADFTQPIELMMDCHRRIEHFLGVLQRVVDRYADATLDQQAREALATALNYFASAAPRHTADEERSLFPRMRAVDDPRVRKAMAQIDRLESDHRRAEAAHARLDVLGRRWLDAGALPPGDAAEFTGLLGELSRAYAQHIPIEDDGVFVLAGRVLDEPVLRAIGREMRDRRVEDPGRDGSRCAQRRREQLNAHDGTSG